MEITRLRSECIQCVLDKHLKRCPNDAPEEKKLEYMKTVLKIILDAKLEDSAPIYVCEIEQLLKEMFGIENEYGLIKEHFNEVMLNREAEIQAKIEAAEDAFKLALQYALVANYIDFGVMVNVDEDYLTELLNTAEERTFSERQFENLKADLSVGKKLVYLTDNCGEIVMDKLLIREIQKNYPQLDITVIVRGMPALNDATMEDAVQTGLTEVVKVIGNGTAVAGTHIEALSEEAKAEFDGADIVLAKGQGNYETMRGYQKNIYYLFLCKCQMFSNMFGVPKMTGMLINETK